MQQTGQFRTSSSANAKQPTAAQALAARRLFGSFRKGEANDPETYVAAVLTVLMDYSDEIVNEICHPGRGLPARCDFLPTMKELKDACEGEAVRLQRLQKYAALPRAEFKRLPRPPAGPGAWATIRVPSNTPQYPRMVEVIKTADKRKWKHGENGDIWVSMDLLDAQKPASASFTQFTDEQLRTMYPPREPAPQSEAAAE